MEQRRWGPLLVLVAAATLTLAGCAGDETEPKSIRTIQEASDHGTFVGTVDGTGANIGLVTKDNKLAGFVCEDKNSSLRLDPVPIENGAAKLVFDGRTVGTVAITDHGAAGKVELGGLQHIFAAEHATGKAGVYRLAATNSDENWDGWIVLNDGTFTGTRKNMPSTSKPWIDPETDP